MSIKSSMFAAALVAAVAASAFGVTGAYAFPPAPGPGFALPPIGPGFGPPPGPSFGPHPGVAAAMVATEAKRSELERLHRLVQLTIGSLKNGIKKELSSEHAGSAGHQAVRSQAGG